MSAAPPPAVTVVVPTHNRAGLVRATLDSLFAQDHRPLELVVVDDGSTDGTADVVQAWAADHPGDPAAGWGMQVLEQANAGACAARNRGFAASSAPLVVFFDSDDLLNTGALARQAAVFADRPEVAFVWSDLTFFRGAPGLSRPPWNRPPGGRPLADHLGGNLLQTSNGMSRRELVEAAGGWPAGAVCGDDWEFNARLLAAAERLGRPVAYLPGLTLLVRIHDAGRLLGRMDAARGVREQRETVARVGDWLRREGLLDGPPGGELRAGLVRRLHALRGRAVDAGVPEELHALAAAAAELGCPDPVRLPERLFARLPAPVRAARRRAGHVLKRFGVGTAGPRAAAEPGPPRVLPPPATADRTRPPR